MEIDPDVATKILEQLTRIATALEVIALHAEPGFQPKTTSGMFLKDELARNRGPR